MSKAARIGPSFPWAWLVLLVVAAVVRGGFLLGTPQALQADPDGYRCLAENLVDRGIFGYGATPTAYRPPLYPLMLAPLVAMGNFATAAIGILHVVLGVATVALVYRLARAWQLGKFSIVAAALVAVDPLLLKQSTLVMTETPAALLAVVALLALTTAAMRPRSLTAAGAGAAVALAALCRPTFLPWMAVSALVLPWFVLAWADRLRIFAAYCLAASIVLSPWMVRNQIHFGRPIAGTTHGGYTLLLANNPWFYQHLQTESWRTVWPADALNQWWVAHTSRATPRDELDADLWAYDAARDTIRRQPAMFLCASILRVVWLWSPLPHQIDPREALPKRLARWTVGLWYTAELGLAAIGLGAVVWRWNRTAADRSGANSTGWFWGILLLLVFTAVHAVFWTNIRMRSPLMPVVAIAAAAGLAIVVRNNRLRKA
ncbi:MAG: hypothetical protein GXY83_31275 [Rhodopirellula sp.]|nr:hypothetical protein [Rhodopirellula sp.]